eukprot:jgi/Mesvir1/26156/Mv06859-RA.4
MTVSLASRPSSRSRSRRIPRAFSKPMLARGPLKPCFLSPMPAIPRGRRSFSRRWRSVTDFLWPYWIRMLRETTTGSDKAGDKSDQGEAEAVCEELQQAIDDVVQQCRKHAATSAARSARLGLPLVGGLHRFLRVPGALVARQSVMFDAGFIQRQWRTMQFIPAAQAGCWAAVLRSMDLASGYGAPLLAALSQPRPGSLSLHGPARWAVLATVERACALLARTPRVLSCMQLISCIRTSLGEEDNGDALVLHLPTRLTGAQYSPSSLAAVQASCQLGVVFNLWRGSDFRSAYSPRELAVEGSSSAPSADASVYQYAGRARITHVCPYNGDLIHIEVLNSRHAEPGRGSADVAAVILTDDDDKGEGEGGGEGLLPRHLALDQLDRALLRASLEAEAGDEHDHALRAQMCARPSCGHVSIREHLLSWRCSNTRCGMPAEGGPAVDEDWDSDGAMEPEGPVDPLADETLDPMTVQMALPSEMGTLESDPCGQGVASAGPSAVGSPSGTPSDGGSQDVPCVGPSVAGAHPGGSGGPSAYDVRMFRDGVLPTPEQGGASLQDDVLLDDDMPLQGDAMQDDDVTLSPQGESSLSSGQTPQLPCLATTVPHAPQVPLKSNAPVGLHRDTSTQDEPHVYTIDCAIAMCRQIDTSAMHHRTVTSHGAERNDPSCLTGTSQGWHAPGRPIHSHIPPSTVWGRPVANGALPGAATPGRGGALCHASVPHALLPPGATLVALGLPYFWLAMCHAFAGRGSLDPRGWLAGSPASQNVPWNVPPHLLELPQPSAPLPHPSVAGRLQHVVAAERQHGLVPGQLRVPFTGRQRGLVADMQHASVAGPPRSFALGPACVGLDWPQGLIPGPLVMPHLAVPMHGPTTWNAHGAYGAQSMHNAHNAHGACAYGAQSMHNVVNGSAGRQDAVPCPQPHRCLGDHYLDRPGAARDGMGMGAPPAVRELSLALRCGPGPAGATVGAVPTRAVLLTEKTARLGTAVALIEETARARTAEALPAGVPTLGLPTAGAALAQCDDELPTPVMRGQQQVGWGGSAAPFGCWHLYGGAENPMEETLAAAGTLEEAGTRGGAWDHMRAGRGATPALVTAGKFDPNAEAFSAGEDDASTSFNIDGGQSPPSRLPRGSQTWQEGISQEDASASLDDDGGHLPPSHRPGKPQGSRGDSTSLEDASPPSPPQEPPSRLHVPCAHCRSSQHTIEDLPWHNHRLSPKELSQATAALQEGTWQLVARNDTCVLEGQGQEASSLLAHGWVISPPTVPKLLWNLLFGRGAESDLVRIFKADTLMIGYMYQGGTGDVIYKYGGRNRQRATSFPPHIVTLLDRFRDRLHAEFREKVMPKLACRNFPPFNNVNCVLYPTERNFFMPLHNDGHAGESIYNAGAVTAYVALASAPEESSWRPRDGEGERRLPGRGRDSSRGRRKRADASSRAVAASASTSHPWPARCLTYEVRAGTDAAVSSSQFVCGFASLAAPLAEASATEPVE